MSKYWWAAFNARPFGMPIPPNWFALAAVGLLGAFVNPGFWLLGAGLELGYLYTLGNSRRFRNAVDAAGREIPVAGDPAEQRYRALFEPLTPPLRQRQQSLESRAREILDSLARSPLMSGHADSVEQLVWLNLRLLAAKQAIARVQEGAARDAAELAAREAEIEARLADAALSPELRRSLEQQKAVIDQRQAGHEVAARRAEHIDSELQRIEQQIALIREQVLLSADSEQVGSALDALSASFNEASRWLDSQRDLAGLLDPFEPQRLPSSVRSAGRPRTAQREGE